MTTKEAAILRPACHACTKSLDVANACNLKNDGNKQTLVNVVDLVTLSCPVVFSSPSISINSKTEKQQNKAGSKLVICQKKLMFCEQAKNKDAAMHTRDIKFMLGLLVALR